MQEELVCKQPQKRQLDGVENAPPNCVKTSECGSPSVARKRFRRALSLIKLNMKSEAQGKEETSENLPEPKECGEAARSDNTSLAVAVLVNEILPVQKLPEQHVSAKKAPSDCSEVYKRLWSDAKVRFSSTKASLSAKVTPKASPSPLTLRSAPVFTRLWADAQQNVLGKTKSLEAGAPGPGAYDTRVPSKQKSHASSFFASHAAQRPEYKSRSPGPAVYESAKAAYFKYNRPSSARLSLRGPARRVFSPAPASPDPGYYYHGDEPLAPKAARRPSSAFVSRSDRFVKSTHFSTVHPSHFDLQESAPNDQFWMR